jgi:hypothetical protein
MLADNLPCSHIPAIWTNNLINIPAKYVSVFFVYFNFATANFTLDFHLITSTTTAPRIRPCGYSPICALSSSVTATNALRPGLAPGNRLRRHRPRGHKSRRDRGYRSLCLQYGKPGGAADGKRGGFISIKKTISRIREFSKPSFQTK